MLLCSTVFGILFELTSKITPAHPSVTLYFIDTIELWTLICWNINRDAVQQIAPKKKPIATQRTIINHQGRQSGLYLWGPTVMLLTMIFKLHLDLKSWIPWDDQGIKRCSASRMFAHSGLMTHLVMLRCFSMAAPLYTAPNPREFCVRWLSMHSAAPRGQHSRPSGYEKPHCRSGWGAGGGKTWRWRWRRSRRK